MAHWMKYLLCKPDDLRPIFSTHPCKSRRERHTIVLWPACMCNTHIHIITINILEVEKWLCSLEHIRLLQKTRVLLLTLMSRGSQPPETPTSGDVTPFLGLCGHLHSRMHIPPHHHTQFLKIISLGELQKFYSIFQFFNKITIISQNTRHMWEDVKYLG